MWWPSSFQARVTYLSFSVDSIRHCTTMNLMKEKHGGLIPMGLKRWPFKLIKHFADTTRVLPSPAGPAARCPLNFLNLINLKFRGRAPNRSCILKFRPNQSFVAYLRKLVYFNNHRCCPILLSVMWICCTGFAQAWKVLEYIGLSWKILEN